jgi:hypothetical protein
LKDGIPQPTLEEQADPKQAEFCSRRGAEKTQIAVAADC